VTQRPTRPEMTRAITEAHRLHHVRLEAAVLRWLTDVATQEDVEAFYAEIDPAGPGMNTAQMAAAQRRAHTRLDQWLSLQQEIKRR
jgi:hypothetical protein